MDNELKHYGVKGMKWRNRKTPIKEPLKARLAREKEAYNKQAEKDAKNFKSQIRANKKLYFSTKYAHMANAKQMSKGSNSGIIASLAAIGEMTTNIYKNSKEYKLLKGEIRWQDYMKKNT